MNDTPLLHQEHCALCGCKLHREGNFALPTAIGRSHATAHHYVPERFFPRTASRRGSKRYRYKISRDGVFSQCPWNMRGKTVTLCYECHEELLHNPVLLPEDIVRFAQLIRRYHLDEAEKSDDRSKMAGRITLLHQIIRVGMDTLLAQEVDKKQ